VAGHPSLESEIFSNLSLMREKGVARSFSVGGLLDFAPLELRVAGHPSVALPNIQRTDN